MADKELDDSRHSPDGVPITPQARTLGFEMPTYVSEYVWRNYCIAAGIPSKHNQTTDGRVLRLVQYCYDGMIKKLATQDDFLWFPFKIWYWGRDTKNATKQKRARLGARLFQDPEDDSPWLYIFDMEGDKDGQPDEDSKPTT